MIIGSKEKPVRLSYAYLFEPVYEMDKVTKKYSVQVLVAKSDTKMVEAITRAVNAAIELGITKKMFNAAVSKGTEFKRCFRDGDIKAAEVDDGSQNYLKGHMFFNAKSNEKDPPVIVDRFGQLILKAEEVYSGCYGIVNVNFFPYAHGKGGIAAGLLHVMKREDGERLDGREALESAFADLIETESEDALM